MLSTELQARLFAGRALPEACKAWRALPALYDADTLLPLLTCGLRSEDRAAAIDGGVAAMNCSVDWHDLVAADDRKTLATLARNARLPIVRLLLTASVDRDTAGFATWFTTFAAAAPEFGLLRACKLYGREPHFRRNLDAVWRAGWRAVVFTQDRTLMAEVADGGGDVLFRHASSPDDIAAMRGRRNRSLIATSPQYLLPVAASLRQLSVRPPLPAPDAVDHFVSQSLADVDVIATDHVAEGATTGPGLASQHHFLPALIHLATAYGLDLGTLLAKATTAPAEVFGVPARSESVAIVAPRSGGFASRSGTGRDPFADTPFDTVVVAVVTADVVACTPAFHTIINKE